MNSKRGGEARSRKRLPKTVPPHRMLGYECTRCRCAWPCPSVLAGWDVPEGLAAPAQLIPPEVVAQAVTGWIEDAGRRRFVIGRLVIGWRTTAKGVALPPVLARDLAAHGDPPSIEQLRRVSDWFGVHAFMSETPSALLERCSTALDIDLLLVERSLLWREALGFEPL